MSLSLRQLRISHCLAAVVFATSQAIAGPPHEIHIPGDHVFPESITSSPDGTVYVGSVIAGGIFRVAPGHDTADVWIKPGADGLKGVFGVYADSRTHTLWACSNTLDPTGHAPPAHGELRAFDLTSGAGKGSYAFPSASAFCNDMAVAPDGSIYATDTVNGQIVRLAPGAAKLQSWSADGAFGGAAAALDGISVVKNAVIVNTLNTSMLYRVPIQPDHSAGPAVRITLDRAIDRPDGMRSFGKSGLLIVESGSAGRLSRITLRGEKGQVSSLNEGYPDGPVAVTLVGQTAYVLEAQFKALAPGAAGKINPFHATAVAVGSP